MVRKQLTEEDRQMVIENSNNKCCVCQHTPMQIHHIDGDSSNNDPDNLAPLCGNCHERAGLNLKATSNMANNLTPKRIKALRNKWYGDCEKIKEGIDITNETVLKVKNFAFSIKIPKMPQIGWANMFNCDGLNRSQVISKVFSEANTSQIIINLESMKIMYQNLLDDDEILSKFKKLCNDLDVNYADLD